MKVLLYSGGMDSWIIDKIIKADKKIYINTHTEYSKEEIKRLPKDVEVIDFPLAQFELPDKIIPMRNLFFVAIASLYGNEIYLGATKGDRVLDKSIVFKEKAENLLNYLWLPQHWTRGKEITINLDFKHYSKTELVRKYKEMGGSLEDAFKKSFSCYNPDHGKECWSCKPCFRKVVAFTLNGYDVENTVKEKVVAFLEKEILPQIKNKTYGRGLEETEIVKAYDILTMGRELANQKYKADREVITENRENQEHQFGKITCFHYLPKEKY